jgi:hypothetical protein
MKKNLFLLTVSSLFLFSAPVLADQCAYITKEQALIAISRLNIGDMIYLFCEPCGEKYPQPVRIQSLSVEKVDYQNYWQVNINNQAIDLAYVFIPAEIDHNFVNLAAIAACPASGVSPVLPRMRH